MASNNRKSIPITIQVEVCFRDGWLCSLCRCPTIFHYALKHLAKVVESERPNMPLAYWDSGWSRVAAPLLDELAACIDQVGAFAKSATHDINNLAQFVRGVALVRAIARAKSTAGCPFPNCNQQT
jgi:hypothetical protein